MNLEKQKIFEMLDDDVSSEEQVKQAIVEYEASYSHDLDLYVIKADYYIQTGELEKARELLEEGCSHP